MGKERKLDPTLKEAVTAAYKRGILEGKERAKNEVKELINGLVQSNNDLLTTNKHLRIQVLRMDEHYPVSGLPPGVHITVSMAERMIASLRNRNRTLAGYLQGAVDKIQVRVAQESADIEEMLVEVLGEE